MAPATTNRKQYAIMLQPEKTLKIKHYNYNDLPVLLLKQYVTLFGTFLILPLCDIFLLKIFVFKAALNCEIYKKEYDLALKHDLLLSKQSIKIIL
jgi:hypothetical protein